MAALGVVGRAQKRVQVASGLAGHALFLECMLVIWTDTICENSSTKMLASSSAGLGEER